MSWVESITYGLRQKESECEKIRAIGLQRLATKVWIEVTHGTKSTIPPYLALESEGIDPKISESFVEESYKELREKSGNGSKLKARGVEALFVYLMCGEPDISGENREDVIKKFAKGALELLKTYCQGYSDCDLDEKWYVGLIRQYCDQGLLATVTACHDKTLLYPTAEVDKAIGLLN